jgi:hypothetical protein
MLRRLASEVGWPPSTVHQVLRRGGRSRRPRPERPAVVRYQWPCPGNPLHMDVKKLGRFEGPGHALTADRTRRSRGAGFEYVHLIVNDCSRLRYSEVHLDERATTVTAFTERALDWFLLVSGRREAPEACVPPALWKPAETRGGLAP